jgi:DNA-binding transcriptional regulator YiaG
MIAQEIRELRLARNLNTKQFGELVGVSARTVEDWEQGRRKPSGSAMILLTQLAPDNSRFINVRKTKLKVKKTCGGEL